MKRKIFTASCLAFSMMTGAAFAVTLIDNSTTGLYNDDIGTVLDGSNPFGGSFLFPGADLSDGDPLLDIGPGDEPDLSLAAASLGDWLTTPATPGGTWSAGPVGIPFSWEVNTETAIIYEIDGGAGGLSNVTADFGVDNGVFVWLNGEFLGGQLRPGTAIPGEFSLDLGDLASGSNFLQILREDHGGGTGWTISVTGDVSAVPLPAGGFLLIGAMGGFAALRRRKARS